MLSEEVLSEYFAWSLMPGQLCLSFKKCPLSHFEHPRSGVIITVFLCIYKQSLVQPQLVCTESENCKGRKKRKKPHLPMPLLLAKTKQGAGLNVSSDHSHWPEMPDMHEGRSGEGGGGGVSEGAEWRGELKKKRKNGVGGRGRTQTRERRTVSQSNNHQEKQKKKKSFCWC